MIVDPEPHTAERASQATAAYLSKITAYLAETSIDVIILNLEGPFEEAFDLLPSLKVKLPNVEIVFVTRFDDETPWVEAIQRGLMTFCQDRSTCLNWGEFFFTRWKASREVAGVSATGRS